MQDLPQEIIDRFVDELSDSPQDLKNACFIGRRWLSRCRAYLFKSITLAPKDLQEIDEYEQYLKRRSKTSIRSRSFYEPFTAHDRAALHTAYASGEERLLSSIPDVLPYIKGLYIDSRIRIGGGRSIPSHEYFIRWLGFMEMQNDVVESWPYAMRSYDKGFDAFTARQERFQAINLPFGPEGLHSSPFRSLRYVRLRWGIFSWMTFDDQDPSTHPAYRFTTFLLHVSGTLRHLAVDDYPGFFELENGTQDFLMHSITRCVPAVDVLALGGLVYPDGALERPNQLHRRGRLRLHDVSPPMYTDCTKVPGVTEVPIPGSHDRSLCLERLFVRGFGSAMAFVEDALLNTGGVDTGKLRYLALSAMEPEQEYGILFRSVGQTLVHLTLDVDSSLSRTSITAQTFPNLETLQLLIRDVSRLSPLLNTLASSVSRLPSHPLNTPKKRTIHLAFPDKPKPRYSLDQLKNMLLVPDKHLYALIAQRGWLSAVSVKPSYDENFKLQEVFPKTYGTGCMGYGKTEEWWYEPVL